MYVCRVKVNAKAGEVAALHEFSNALTLSQPRLGGRLYPPIDFASLQKLRDHGPVSTLLEINVYTCLFNTLEYLFRQNHNNQFRFY